MDEYWVPIPGHFPYEASSEGRIRRGAFIETKVISHLPRKPMQAPRAMQTGYPIVTVKRDGATKPYCANVHMLVALAFHGVKPSRDYTVAHGDGDRANNKPENLRWATWRENHLDKHDHGTMPHQRGEAHGQAKLNDDKVIQIVNLLKWDVPQSRIAAHYGVRGSTISKISLGLRWSHITGINRCAP